MKSEKNSQEYNVETPFWKSNIFWLTYPIWGTILTMGLVGYLDSIHINSTIVGYAGMLLLPLSLMPIVNQELNILIVIIQCIAYISFMAIPVFFLGWMSLCMYQPHCY
jgi:hypothetical protein